LAELLEKMDRSDILRELVITDASTGMLAHSLRWAKYGAMLQCAQACSLPYRDGWFDLVLAAAGDPYNENATWREAARVLREGGYCIFTTPSYQWAVNYRKFTNSEIASAEFESRSGRKIMVPSFISPRRRQECELKKAGLYPLDYQIVKVRDLAGQNIPPKLLLSDGRLPIMEGYIAQTRVRGSLSAVDGDLFDHH
jgi:SAM-dependent methyltransferase